VPAKTRRAVSAFRRRIIVKTLPLVAALTLGATAVAADNDVYLSVPAQGSIMRVDLTTGQSSTHATGVLIPHYGWFMENGDMIVPDRGWPAVLKISPTGVVSALSAGGMLKKPVTAIPAPTDDGILLSDTEAMAIFHIAWDGTQTVYADFASTNGLLTGPDGFAIAPNGDMYIANLVGDTIIKVDPQGNASLFSNSANISEPGGLVIDNSGNMFVAMYGNSKLMRYRIDTGEEELFAFDFAKMKSPSDLKLSRSGGLLASTRNSNILRIHPGGDIDVLFHDSSFGDIVGVSSPEDATLCTGKFESYGTGVAGSGGFVPELRALFSPCPGQEIGIEFKDFLGGAPAYFFIGFGPAAYNTLGGTVLVDVALPTIMIPIPMPGAAAGEGDLVLPFTVPNQANLVGLELYYQALGADPGAQFGVSFSNGLHETIGS